MFFGPAIGYIILGSALYKFRKHLGMKPEPYGQWIGFSFWWGGWFALFWAAMASILQFQPFLHPMGLVLVVFWVGFRGLRIAQVLGRNS